MEGADEEAVFEAAMEAGADDIQPVADDDGNPTTSYKARPFWMGAGGARRG